MNNNILLGAHLSISGGLEKAILKAAGLDINALQIFTKNASAWKEKILTEEEINKFSNARKNSKIKFIFSHDSYLINLASPDKSLWEKSAEALKNEFTRSIKLSLNGVIIHPGAHIDSGAEQGLDRIADALNLITGDINESGFNINKKFIILETTAGQGSCVGHKFEQINYILSKLNNRELFGVCYDSAHVFASGYDISTESGYEKNFKEFNEKIGLDKLTVFHLNDSLKELGSCVDRHGHIGKGKIGGLFFKLLMNDERFNNIPKIIQTPKGDDDEFDKMNLTLLKKMCRVNGK